MSRSYNKNAPSWGKNKRPTDRFFKNFWHKKMRQHVKRIIEKGDEKAIVNKHEVSDLSYSSRDDSPHRMRKEKLKEYLNVEFNSDIEKGYQCEKNRKKETSVNYKNRK